MWSLLLGKFQKGACRYLLHRYLGQYLREKVTVDQLTVDLYNGTGSVTDVSLDCDALNNLADEHGLPIEFVDGTLEEITFSIPWSTLMQDSCEIQIKGLRVTVQPKGRERDDAPFGASSMLDSMFGSMASSMQLAEEALKKCEDIEDDPADMQQGAQEMSGLEHCANTIDAILSRIKISFHDTLVRVEKCAREAELGIGLEFHIKLWKYSDDSENIGGGGGGDNDTPCDSAFTHKRISLEGVTCHTQIFSRKQRESEDESDDDEAHEVKPKTVQIGKLSGVHEIKLRVKTDESMAGPQVFVDCSFGSFLGLLTPLQAHIVMTLISEIIDPSEDHCEEGKAWGQGRRCSEKPMDSFDLKRVEKELQELAKPENIGIVGGLGNAQAQGWSSACFDDSDDEFQPLKGGAKGMYQSAASNFMNSSILSTNSVTSSVNSSMHQSSIGMTESINMNASTYKSAYNYSSSGQNMNASEKTKFSLSFTSVSFLLLHEDVMSLSAAEGIITTTLEEMQKVARDFFERLYYFGATVKGEKDVCEVREKLGAACDKSHHRIIAAPLKVKGSIGNCPNTGNTSTCGTLSIGYFEVTECLMGVTSTPSTPKPECIQVLVFPKEQGHSSHIHHSQAALKLDFKSETYRNRGAFPGKSYSTRSKTNLKFLLSECRSELDISVMDRVGSLLTSPLHLYINPTQKTQPFITHSQRKGSSVIKINVKSPKMSVDFRFPIPDLRPLEDPCRTPYWIRSLHPDSVIIELKEVDFSTSISSNDSGLEFDTRCHEARLYYKKTPGDSPTLFATALADDPEIDGMSLRSQGLDWPRVVVWINPRVTSSIQETGGDDESQDHDNFDTMNFMNMPKSTPSPFSSKRVVHEAVSTSGEDGDSENQSNTSVIPGDRAEMNEFIEDTSKNVMYKIDLNFRFVDVSLPSKHFFEEIYNRVGNDLLLWEPYSSIKSNDSPGEKRKSPFHSAFAMCKSAIRFDPEEEDEEVAAFFSPAGEEWRNLNKPGKSANPIVPSNFSGQSEVTLSLRIGKGIGVFFPPLQDLSGNTVPNQKGQFLIRLQEGSLFFVSGYKGNPELGYISFIAQKAEMHHADLIRSDLAIPLPSTDLSRTIFPSEDGMGVGEEHEGNNAGDMISVAVKIEREPEKKLKVFKVTVGIRDGTLDHKLYLPSRNWFAQLTDFFDVKDMPILGYIPSEVLTEFHLHLWNCGVAYRPLHLPLKAHLTMDTFSISSNIAAQTSMSVLRFLAEDAAFFITAKTSENLSLREDYVCVADMDYFELSLRLCTNRASTTPKIDLTANSNALHIRSCSDSFKALVELLTYYTKDGDLLDPAQMKERDTDSLRNFSPMKECSSEPALITTEELPLDNNRKLSASHTEAINDMVSEAMQEADFSRGSRLQSKGKKSKSKKAPMCDMYFTPEVPIPTSSGALYPNDADLFGECGEYEESTTPLPFSAQNYDYSGYPSVPIMETQDGLPVEITMSDEDEEEFCILENDPGVGIIPKNGEPEARLLTDEPIRLIENHFTPPSGKMDALKAPTHYPNPVEKYSLKELTLVWHLYGGEDLGLQQNHSRKNSERGSSETVYSESWKDKEKEGQSHGQGEMFYEPEVDMAVDALNPGVVFSKTKAFETAWEAYESPKGSRKMLPEGCTSWRHQGGKGRRHDILVELHLNKIKFVHEMYPDTTEQASRQVIIINTVEILDKLRSSQFNKLLYLYTTPQRPRQTHASMVTIKCAHVRPDPQLSIEEASLKISILPIRLNIDQDALLFLYQYFSELSMKCESEDDDSVTNPPSHTPSVESLPVMTVNVGDYVKDNTAVLNVDEEGATFSSPSFNHNQGSSSTGNLLMFNEDPFGMDETASTSSSREPSIDSSKSNAPVYFRLVIFAPEVPIRLDYRGKRVDMTHGPLAGVLMGLAQLNCSEIRLKQVYHRHGILGFDRLVAFLINEWATDIKKNQLPSLLGGVGPIHSFVQMFQGVRDLFWLPIEQYQKDGRIAKGLQRGVNAFSTSTAMAALDLTNKLIQTVQGAAEFTYDMVSPGPSVQHKRRQFSHRRRKRYSQPGDIREGMANAYTVVKEGLGDTASTIVRVASKEHEQKGISGAVGGVLRQIPPTVVRPIILVAEATSTVLDGVRSQLEPEFKKESEEKWKET